MSQLPERARRHRGVGRLMVGNLILRNGSPVFTATLDASLRLIIVCTAEDSAAIFVHYDGCLDMLTVTCDRATQA